MYLGSLEVLSCLGYRSRFTTIQNYLPLRFRLHCDAHSHTRQSSRSLAEEPVPYIDRFRTRSYNRMSETD